MKNSYKEIISLIGLTAVSLLFCVTAFSQDIDGANALDASNLKSSQVFEGQLISQSSFFNANKSHIYTTNTIKVFKTWESDILSDTIQVVSLGGVIGNQMEQILPVNPINISDIGIFAIQNVNGLNWKLNFSNTNQINPQEIYQHINLVKNKAYKVVSENPRKFNSQKGNSNIEIFDFQPKELAAGTLDTLSIYGKGFGNSVGFGYILFKNNNDAGATYTMPSYKQIISWNDSVIKCLVPHSAGSGKIMVVNSSDEKSDESLNSLMIKYSIYNTAFKGNYYIPSMISTNNTGGYNITVDPLMFANTLVLGDLNNSINNWNCKTGANLNFKGIALDNKAERDGKNLVRMSLTSELPNSMLALTIGYYNGCNDGTQWYLKEFDMIVNSNFKWALGTNIPLLGEYDLKTVLLHEIGHVMQMGHSNNIGNIMYPSLKDGASLRGLKDPNAIEGTAFSSNYSKEHPSCTLPVYAENFITDCLEENTGVLDKSINVQCKVYPNPSNGTINISSVLAIASVDLFTMQGVKVCSQSFIGMNHDVQVDFAKMNLNSGLYYLRIVAENQVQVDKTIAIQN